MSNTTADDEVAGDGADGHTEGGEDTLLDLFGEREFTVIGIVSAFIAVSVVPLAFGGLSAYCGYQIYRHHHTKNGIAVMILGLGAMIQGLLTGGG
ncbi:hypothetical protein [Halosimplex pelagicum]|uniref:Uncharacterized protein n=1 Tax=Halosimplex pelagicum TaxID=869886 RepID=A0A7D5P813_9EURY|nr:hypothetical protein [Halosimplex pelagicum]QLH80984.1 hypothetical protein HZS54_04740 [Halosimplex pelagicum]